MSSSDKWKIWGSVVAGLVVTIELVAQVFGFQVSLPSLLSVTFSPTFSFHDGVRTLPPEALSPLVSGVMPRSAVPQASSYEQTSYNCESDTKWAEQQVCHSAELAAYDRKIDLLYRQAKSGSTEELKLALRDSQRAWIKQRNNCEFSADGAACLQAVYTGRIAELQSSVNGGTAEADAAAPRPVEISAIIQSPPVAINRVQPSYPLGARFTGTQGRVVVEFVVTKDGVVRNPIVVKSDPPGVFDQEAIDAVTQWRYRPAIVGGRAVDTTGMHVEIEFALKR